LNKSNIRPIVFTSFFYLAQPVLSEEEKERLFLKEKLKKEYLAALKKEGLKTGINYLLKIKEFISIYFFLGTETNFRGRIELIKLTANRIIAELKLKADNTYKEMDDKLGDRFVKEIESVKFLCNYIKHCIENKEKIKRDLALDQDGFYIEQVNKIF